MKLSRWIAALAAIACCCVPARAQNSAAGNISASSTNCTSVPLSCVWEQPLPFNAATTTINISGTFSATLLVEESNNGGQTWSTAATLSSAGTTTYSTNGFTDIRVRCSAYVSGTAAVTISTGLNTGLQGPPGPAGSGGGITQVATLPTTPCTNNATAQLTVAPFGIYTCIQGVWSLDAPTGNVVYATNYGVQTGFRLFDAKFTNGSNTITISGTDPPFNAATMNGWTCYGTTTSGGGANHIGAKVAMTEGTITVTSGTTATSTGAGNVNAANTLSQTLVCGPIMDTQLTAAETAAWGSQGSCSALMLPAGIVLVEKGHFQTVACQGGIFGNLEPAATVMGYGYKVSLITTTPNFDFTTCTAGPTANWCFGGTGGVHYFMFGIWGGENGTANPASGKSILGLTTDNQMSFVWVTGWGAAGANLTGLTIGTIGQYQVTGGVDGAGGFANCDITGVFVQLTAMFCGDTAGTPLRIEIGAQVRDFGSAYGVQGTSGSNVRNLGGDYNGYGISCLSQTTGNGACVEGDGGNTYLDQLRSPAGNVPAQGVWVNGAGAKVSVGNSILSGTVNPILVSSGKYFDIGSNTFNGGGANSFAAGSLIADGHSVKGTCTGSASASSTLGLYGTGPNATTTTCTSTTIGSGFPVSGARTLQNLNCSVGVAGTTASTCTVLVNGGASTITCTIAGAGTNCSDGTHSVALNDGDLVSIEFISGAVTTPQGVKAIVEWQ